MGDKDKKAAADSVQDVLKEDNGAAREGKFLVMGSRREGGQLVPIKFVSTQTIADGYAEALTETGWATCEVYTRTGAHTRK